MAQTNSSRAAASELAVRRDERLAQAARRFAEYMTKSGRFEHHADGGDVLVRARSAGYEPRVVCENLYLCKAPGGITSAELAEAAVQGWLASEGHRRNMLDLRVSEIGIGVAGDPRTGAYYVVEVLARPQRGGTFVRASR